jgi:hypothetical protein
VRFGPSDKTVGRQDFYRGDELAGGAGPRLNMGCST